MRGGNWELVYKKELLTRSEAVKFERKIKSMKSRKFINKLISEYNK